MALRLKSLQMIRYARGHIAVLGRPGLEHRRLQRRERAAQVQSSLFARSAGMNAGVRYAVIVRTSVKGRSQERILTAARPETKRPADPRLGCEGCRWTVAERIDTLAHPQRTIGACAVTRR